ncbi:hypothetical protein ABZ897_53750 [Nonomuraea sp. NPDC046802]|uniref:hypothetical protein n=1 Tax=Nonomuraea sp. NPDC046802 TaxID=3154919 RepID=UPI0033D2AE56
MAEDLGPGHAVLAIKNDTRRFYSWPVDYGLAWEQAVVMYQADERDCWVLGFEDGTRVARHREAFMRLSFHTQAYGERGQALMDTGIFSDMGMYADSRTLEGAEEVARNMFSDTRVASVGIERNIQETRGSSWKPGKYVKTIKPEV